MRRQITASLNNTIEKENQFCCVSAQWDKLSQYYSVEVTERHLTGW
jgi:hypothetical protein